MNYVKAFTRAGRVLAGLLVSIHLGAAHAATITVNPGQRIQDAVNAAKAGDTVRVTVGTYTEKVLIANRSGAAGAFIILKADPGAIISGVGLKLTGREGVVTVRNSSYVRVEGFDITGLSATGDKTPVGILVDGGGSNLEILNNKIHDIKNNDKCADPCSVGAHGLAVFGTSSKGLTDILVQGNEVYDNVLQSSEALVINGNVDRFEVLNNYVHDNNNIGFDFIGYEKECAGCGENDRARNGLVRNNIARNNSSLTNPWYRGDTSAGGFYVDGGRNIIFDRNISTGNDIGFEFASEHGGKATEDILMMNNLVYNNGQVGVTLGGASAKADDNGKPGFARRIGVYNNTFYRNKGWGTEVVLQNNVIDAAFANNIFFGKGTIAENYEAKGVGYSGNSWRTNLWWGAASKPDGLPGTLMVADPALVAPQSGNLKLLKGSPARDVGTPGAALTSWSSPLWARYFPAGAIPVNGIKDFSGEARMEGQIDLGADEYGTSGAETKVLAVPTQFAATAVSSSQINLTWHGDPADEASVRIERSLSAGGSFAEIGVAPGNASSWQDNGLRPATGYSYRVRASNASGNSAYTPVATTATLGAAGSVNIVVDGKTADWAGIAPLSVPGSGGITALKAHADASYLYVLVTGVIGNNYSLFINKDNSATTGYTDSFWSQDGSDYLLENGQLFKYTGSGANWLWSASGVSTSGGQIARSADALELKIPRANLAGAGPVIRIGVEFADANWNTTGVIPAAGGVQAQFAF